MYKRYTLLLAITLALGGSAMAAPVTRFAPGSVSRAINTVGQPDESWLILAQTRGTWWWRRSAGCGWRAARGRRREPQRQFQRQQL